MKKMRRIALFVLAIALVLAAVSIAACNGDEATVTFDGNGSTGGTAPAAITTKIGETITLPECKLTKTGHTFDGWKLGNDVYDEGDEFVVASATTTFIAQWKEDGVEPTTHTVTFNPNNDAATWTEEITEGETVAKPANDPTIASGKMFMYWADDSDVEFDFATPITSDITITAIYAWKVTFSAGEGTGTVDPIWVRVWTASGIKLPGGEDLQNGEKEFVGWSDGTNTYEAGERFVGTGNETLTAVWKSNQKFGLAYAAGEHGTGTAPAVEQVAEGDSVKLKSANLFTAEDGYVFDGWLVEGEQTTRAAGSNFTMPARAVTITAQWKQASQTTYSVTYVKSENDSHFNSISGSLPENTQLTEGAAITMPAANTLTFPHYTLSKWRVYVFSVTSDGQPAWSMVANFNPGDEYTMPAKAIQIRAVWTKNQATISFDANGGSGTMNAITKDYGTTLSVATINCQFTAPANKKFAYWSSSANGTELQNGSKLEEPLVSAQDTLTLYAIWTETTEPTPTTPLIDDIKGSWTATEHTLDIIAATEVDNEFVKGYAILDGQHFLRILDNDGVYLMCNSDPDTTLSPSGEEIPNPYCIFYGISYANSTLTLTPDEGDALTFGSKTTLENTSRSAFQGKWSKVLTNGSQPWVITDTSAYYNSSLTEALLTAVIGDKFVIVTESLGNEYAYVLSKQGESLMGYYKASEKAAESTTFNAGTFLTLTVEGKLNQVVNAGAAPNADKIKAPTAPEGQVFSKWVLAGTETEFVLTAAMTADASIEATFTTASGSSIKTYTGSFTKGFYTYKEIVVNESTCEISITYTKTGNDTTVSYSSTFSESDNAYHIAAIFTGDEIWVVISGNGQTLTVCEDWNGPDLDETWGTLTLA